MYLIDFFISYREFFGESADLSDFFQDLPIKQIEAALVVEGSYLPENP